MQKSTETPRDSIDHIKDSSWSDASKIVSGFQNEPLFIEYLNSYEIDPHDKTTIDYANALSFYANDYCT
ncbi:MAG: hypothetical protein ABJA64_02760, partial [Candidatus Saccharibacteria bacterium]